MLHSETHPSEIYTSHKYCGKVQDSYTLRCVPQVHGIVYDTLDFVRGILETEMNAATDNPMVFPDQQRPIISGGNFHGEYPGTTSRVYLHIQLIYFFSYSYLEPKAKAMDYAAIAVHELGNISERRIERLVNTTLSGLPAFLVGEGGLNSGFMIAHCTAAAMVSENKVLCHPASVDSISTSAAKEDHVSMGGWAARKALLVVDNVETVLAIEALCACQALDFLAPLTTTKPLMELHALVRSVVPHYDRDRYMKPDIDAAKELFRQQRLWEILRPYWQLETEKQ